MKKFLRIAAALMAVFAMTNFIACSSDSSDDDDDGLKITAESNVTTVEVGKTITLTLVGTTADATWESSDTSKATVQDGTVTGVAAGEVTITAKAEGKSATIKITVKAASSSDDSGSTGGSGSGDSGSTGGTGSGDSGTTGGSGSGDSGSTGGTGEYKVVYEGVPINEETYTLEEATAMATEFGLVENTDYTINTETKIITLTESGKAKVDAAMGGSGEGGETSTTVTANVYNLAALTNEDYVTLGSVIDGTAQQYSDSKGTLKDLLKISKLDPAVTLSSGLIVYNSSDNQILVRTTSASVLTPAGAINYGGQSVGDKTNNGTVPANVGDAVALSDTVKVSRYLAIPVTGGDAASQFKVTVKYKPTNEKGIQIVLVDQNNVMLAKDDVNTSKTEKTFVTPAITKGEVTEVRVYLFRTGDATSGGADVSEISIAPVTGE